MDIIISNRIRFSDLASMDDPNELNYLWNHYIKRLVKKSGADYNFVKNVCKSETDDRLYFSFSLTDDPGSKRMWKNYADKGRGVCVGFDPNVFDLWRQNIEGGFRGLTRDIPGIESGELTTRDLQNPDYRDVNYLNSREMREEIERHIGGCHFFGDNNDGYEEILNDAPFMKKKKFEYERESRILIMLRTDPNNDLLPTSCRYEGEEVPFTWYSNGRTWNYPSFYIPLRENMIRSIVLGSKCEMDEKYLRLFLRSYGYDVDNMYIG